MIKNALVVSLIVFVALALLFIQQCDFLIPYKTLIFGQYLDPILLFAAALFFNIFSAVYTLYRAVFLKDTGRKLAHVEKQLRTGTSISAELNRRLTEEP